MKNKNKLTINTLAMGNLKQRRKQYTILIIGIILAMVFSSGIPFFISCLQTSNEETNDRLFGRQEDIFVKATDVDFEKLKADGFVEEYSLAHTIGFAYKDEETKDVGTAVAWLEDKAVEMYYPFLHEGRLPEKEGEIAIEKSTLMQLGFEKAVIGDALTLNLKVPDGKGFSDKTEKRTYTLVGIAYNKKAKVMESQTPEITAYMPSAYVYKGEQTAVGGKELLVGFVNTGSGRYQGLEWSEQKLTEYYELTEQYHTVTTGYREESNGTSGTDIWSSMLYSTGFAIILTLVSCLAIVNAFANNLRQRKRQIGMLRAVGATKRQIVTIYAREAFIISLISAPVSVLISYFGVKLITRLIGDDLVFLPKVWILLVGALLGVIIVMCAAVIPLIPVSRSSPMQAIRNIDYTRKLRRKKIRSQKNFDVSKLLAKRNITLARSRQVVVSIILAITIICSCLGFSALGHELDQADYDKYEYDLYNDANFEKEFLNVTLDYRGYTDNDISEIMSTGYFEEILAIKSCQANILTDEFTDYELLMSTKEDGINSIYDCVDDERLLTEENYRKELTKKFSKSYLDVKKRYNYNSLILNSTFVSVNDELFEGMKDDVVEGEINLDKLNSGEEIILIAPEKIGFYFHDYGEKYGTFLEYSYIYDSRPAKKDVEYIEIQERSYKVGDEIDLSIISASMKDKKQFVKTDRKVKIGAILNTDPSNIGWQFPWIDGIGILTTNSASHYFAPEVDYNSLYVKAKGEVDDEFNSIIAPYLENVSLSIPNGRLRNNYEFARDNENGVKVIILGFVCIIGLFLAICGCVVNNALTARIREGKRDIGTLRAVGADLKVLSSSYIRQVLVIFGYGYGIGFTAYIAGYWLFVLLNKTLQWNKQIFEFRIVETMLMCGMLFLVCAVNLVIKIKQEMKHSIVENIREL